MNCHVLTVVSDPNKAGFLKYLSASCRYYDILLEVLIAPKSYSSHNLKDQMLLDFLKTVPINDYVLFTDGYDSFFMSTLSELITKFEKMKKEAFFSVEMTCWPDASLKSAYFPEQKLQDSPYRYLNSGGFIGTCGFLKFLLKMPIPSAGQYPTSNQYRWTIRYLENCQDIGLDHNCELFIALAPALSSNRIFYKEAEPGSVKEMDFYHPQFVSEGIPLVLAQIAADDNRIISTNTGSTPCHIHFNGSIGNHILKSGLIDELLPWL